MSKFSIWILRHWRHSRLRIMAQFLMYLDTINQRKNCLVGKNCHQIDTKFKMLFEFRPSYLVIKSLMMNWRKNSGLVGSNNRCRLGYNYRYRTIDGNQDIRSLVLSMGMGYWDQGLASQYGTIQYKHFPLCFAHI